MNKKFTKLFAALALLVFMMPSLAGWGQTRSTITINYNDTFNPTLPTASGSVNTSSTQHTDETASNFVFKEQGIYKGSSSDYLMFAQNKGFLYNTQSLGTITSVAVTYSSGTSTSAKAGVYFGSSEQSTYTTSDNVTIKGQSKTDTWTNSTNGYGYFQFSTSNKNCQVTKIEITYTSAPAYTITAQSNNEQYGTVSLNGSVITGSPKSGCRYASPAYSVSPANSATVSQDGNAFTVTPSANTTVTINFEAIPTHTATFSVNGSPTSNTFYEGQAIQFPANPAAISGKSFVGWSETTISGTTNTAPTLVTSATMGNSDVTYYAVFADAEESGDDTYEKLNSNSFDTNAQYVIGATQASANNTMWYLSSYSNVNQNVNWGVMTSTPETVSPIKFTLSGTADALIAQDESNNYLKGLTSGAFYMSSSSTTVALTNSGTIKNNSNGTYYLRHNYNSGNGGLRWYSSNTGTYAYFYKFIPGVTYSNYCTTVAGVATPVITVAANPFLFSTTATITCATDGATIKYSYDGETWNAYSSALTITETTTVYAKAIKDAAESSVASVDITKNLATLTPSITSNSINIGATATVSATGSGTLPTITLTTSNSSIASVSETTVTGVAAGSAIITATWSANADYNAGNQNFSVTVVDPNAPGTVNNPYTVAQAINAIDNSGNVTGVYATGIVSQVTYYSESNHYINYYISADGLTSGQQLEAFHGKGINGANFSSINDVKAGDVVVIYGNLTYYSQTSTYEFEADNQLVSLRRISIDHTELSFSYVQNTAPGSANEKELTVSGEGLNENITVALGEGMSAYYELFDLSGDDWTTAPIVLTIDGNGDVEETTIGVRIKSGLGKGVYNGNLNITSGNVSRVVTLSGSVTAQLYDITFNQPTGGTLSTTVDDEPVTSAEENAVVTLVATPETGYSFVNNWAVLKDDLVTPVEISEGTFTMPNCDVIVSGTFSQINYIIIVADTQHGTVESSNETANYGDDIIVTVTPETGYRVQSFTVAETGGAGTVTEIEVADDTYSFDMPAFNITVTVVFEVIPEAYSGGVFELHTGNITEGYYIITYNNEYVMKNEISSNRFANGTYPTITNNTIDDPNGDLKDIVWHIQPDVVNENTYWTLYNDDAERYAAGTGTKNYGALIADITDYARWTVTNVDDNNVYDFENLGRANGSSNTGNKWLRNNGDNGWAPYADATGGALTLYKKLPDVAPTWTSFPTTAGVITNAEYELTVSDYVSGNPAPDITLYTEESNTLYEYEDGYFAFRSNVAGEYAFTFTAANVAGSANVTLTITVSAPVKVTYRYSTNGELGAATQITQGESVTLAAAADLNEDFTFAGWTDNLNDVEHNIHAAETSYQVNNDVALYAVYEHEVEGTPVTTYNKVTSISEGDYLIVYETGNLIFDGSLETLDAAGNTKNVTIIDGAIESNVSNDAAVFTISEVTGGYSIQSVSGYYIGQTNDSNGLTTNTTTTYTNSISFDIEKNANIVSGGAYLRYNSASNQTRFRYYKSSSYTSQQAIQLYKKETTTPTTTVYYTHVQLTDITANTNISLIPDPIVIPSGSVIDAGSYLTNTNPANLIIEDGGRLIVYNEGVKATVKKNVEKATTWGAEKSGGVDGWYFIASPVNGAAFPTGTINDQDIYQLDWVNKKWLNLQNDAHSSLLDAGFRRGTGYLYASKDGNTISVAGEIQPLSGDDDATVTLSVDGWNLIGNPLTCKVTVDKAFSELTNGFAVTNQLSGSTINPCQGIAVYGDAGTTVTFTKAATQNAVAPSNNYSLQMTLAKTITSRGEVSTKVVDNAVVSFNNSKGMPKFNMLGGNAKLYIPQNNEEYAVVFSDRQGDMPLNFKADELGTYTINFETSDRTSLQGIYLIDMLEEQEIDLSVEPSYTFIGSPADRAARFKIVFRTGFENSPNNIFAYQNGSDIVVCGEGELQIFDVMGRMVNTQRISGVETINVKSQGVYIMKLNEKTQKIVVR